jgi:hypothetical protein
MVPSDARSRTRRLALSHLTRTVIAGWWLAAAPPAAAEFCLRHSDCPADWARCRGNGICALDFSCVYPPGPDGYVCRPSAGPCDIEETCLSGACPADAFHQGNVCRTPANDCDRAERCPGATAACPADAPSADGEACEAVSACMRGGMCQASVCVGGVPQLALAPEPLVLEGTGREAEVTVTYSGNGPPIELTGATLEPEDAFAIAVAPTWPRTLVMAEQARLRVRLLADAPGSYAATLRVQAAGCADLRLSISGTVDPTAPSSGGCASATGAGGGAAVVVLAISLLERARRRRRWS